MSVIDAAGLFGGDRFDLVSDEARLYWPHFWCASNTAGRIELNYRKLCASAFGRWKKRPTEEKFWSIIAEYRDGYLLFVYEVEGGIWGAWDTSEKFLPRHKHAADLRSPAPAVRDFLEWKNEYVAKKNAKSNAPTNFVNRAPNGADAHTNVRGIGVGVGGGIGKTSVAKTATVSACDSWFDSEFWPIWPVKENVGAARVAVKKIKPEDFGDILSGVARQAAKIRAMDRPIHASTWLNNERWKDETANTLFDQSPDKLHDPSNTRYID